MAPPYHQDSSPPSSFHETDLHFSDHLFFPSTPQAASSSSSSSLSFPMNMIFPHDHTAQDHVHGGFFNTDAQQLQLKQEGGVIVPCNIGSSYDMDQTVGNDHPETGLRLTINWKKIDKSESSSSEINHGSMKWSSSKMRLVMNSDQTEAMTIDSGRNFQDRNQTSTPSDQTVKRSYNNSLNDGGNAIIRTCSDCNTTKTPLWRSGPRGPKSLCNACGIRQRKARRAMAAAAEAAAGCSISCGGKPAAAVLKANKVQQKAIKRAAAMNGNLPHTLMKKKCKESAATTAAAVQSRGRKKICFEDIAISGGLSESSSAYQRVFPQDEREAAILLMTLSYGYGLLHG